MGDPEGLFTANQNRVFRYFCRAVGHAEPAHDLTQEVFLRVCRTSIPAAANGDLTGWLFRIARNPRRYQGAGWFRSTVQLKPNEIVEVALRQPDDVAAAPGARVFSLRIQAKQLR